MGREVLSPVALTSLVSRIVSNSTRLSVKEAGLVPVVFVSESDKMLVTFIFGIGERVTIVFPIFFYHNNSAESLPRLGLGRVLTPSAPEYQQKLVRKPASLRVIKKLWDGWKITIKYPSNIKLYTSNCTIAGKLS